MPSIIMTRDGSHSLLNETLNETYHSTHGALQESRYVFIEQGLKHFHSTSQRQAINILEVGFGTGLNALLALQYSMDNQTLIEYETVETFPLPDDIWKQLNYADELKMTAEFDRLHKAPWEINQSITEKFYLTKKQVAIQVAELKPGYDLIFYDAFAPSKQPDMWAFETLDRVVGKISPEGIFVTYCAMGQMKRDLRTLGLEVETLPGPPGKKEMVRARRTLH